MDIGFRTKQSAA